MRPIVNSTFGSLDGVVNHMQTWHFDYPESDALAMDQLAASDAMLMGRATYDVYAPAWSTRDGEYADRINALPKFGGKDELLHTDGLTVSFDHADTRVLKSGVVVLSYRARTA